MRRSRSSSTAQQPLPDERSHAPAPKTTAFHFTSPIHEPMHRRTLVDVMLLSSTRPLPLGNSTLRSSSSSASPAAAALHDGPVTLSPMHSASGSVVLAGRR